MARRERKKKLVGPWRNIHGGIWLIGLAILAWRGWWWPGILVLIAFSGIIEAILMQRVPEAFIDEETPVDQPTPAPPPPMFVAAPKQEHRPELMPKNCPQCGGPIRGHEVRWTGSQSADCPYCGTNLPMKKV